jgi:hypothetical protein
VNSVGIEVLIVTENRLARFNIGGLVQSHSRTSKNIVLSQIYMGDTVEGSMFAEEVIVIFTIASMVTLTVLTAAMGWAFSQGGG